MAGDRQACFKRSKFRLVPVLQWFLLGVTVIDVVQKNGLVRLIYNLLFTLFFILSAPFYLWKLWRRGNWKTGFLQRFGFYGRQLESKFRQGRPIIWLHAVSVGEVNICLPIQQRLAELVPDHDWLISTTTATGMTELQAKAAPGVLKIYYPVDFGGTVKRALRLINPRMIVLVEAEIWPNLNWQAKACGIPVCLANARLSDSSYRGYRRASFLFSSVFASFAAVGVQAEKDLPRWVELGCRPEAAVLTGNVKFDAAPGRAPGRVDVRGLLADLGLLPEMKIIVGGSTHPGEEKLLAEAYLKLKAEIPDLLLILVPRHMEKAKQAAESIAGSGLTVLLRSELPVGAAYSARPDCLVVNSTGELLDFYAVADVVFVGKSLRVGGGQNPIEPAALGKPVIFGSRMGNFRDVVRILQAQEAAIPVTDGVDLTQKLRQILTDPELARQMSRQAAVTVTKNRGSLAKTARMLAQQIER